MTWVQIGVGVAGVAVAVAGVAMATWLGVWNMADRRFAELRAEMRAEFADVRAEMRAGQRDTNARLNTLADAVNALVGRP